MTDELIELATRATGGERHDLEALLAASVGPAHAVARARLGDSAAAEAATAETLTRIASGLGRLAVTADTPPARVIELLRGVR